MKIIREFLFLAMAVFYAVPASGTDKENRYDILYFASSNKSFGKLKAGLYAE